MFLPVRARATPLLWLQARAHLSVALQTPSPASLAVESLPYPSARPNPAVFEPMSDEYAAVSAAPAPAPPPSSADALVALVLGGDFRAADALRREMRAHRVPIPHDARYLRAALHAISARRPKGPAHAQQRLDAFVSWLALVPSRDQQRVSFVDIRQRLFRSMDHLNLTLVYRFGVVLASKGYHSGDTAMQVVSTLARYARPAAVQVYLRQVEDATKDYYSKKGTDPPTDLLVGAYSLAIRTFALGGKGEAALGIISMARSRHIRVPDFTLNIVAKHALDQQTTIDHIRTAYPSWVVQDTQPLGVECESLTPEHTDVITALAARLRSLRTAIRSPSPPSPHALHAFISSYQALGRARALPLLRSLACRYSPKSASTWVLTEMLYHRSRKEHVPVLFSFWRYFHPVGVPRKTLLSIVRGPRGKQARKERRRPWDMSPPTSPLATNGKLWPTAYHTALVWDAILALSARGEQERLYALLLSLVRRSRQLSANEGALDTAQVSDDRVHVQLPPDAFDAAHFSPFVSSWSRRAREHGPARAARVLRDMVDLGIEPTLVQWSMVARGYAQHDNGDVALRILDRMVEKECVPERSEVAMEMNPGSASETGTETSGTTVTDRGEPGTAGWTPSDALLGLHTNVLRGFVIAEDAERAREVEKRLIRLGYRAGERVPTDAGVAMLRDLEARKGTMTFADDRSRSRP